ncbi:unnamed protein product, partial [Rotaria magnacalcarata]
MIIIILAVRIVLCEESRCNCELEQYRSNEAKTSMAFAKIGDKNTKYVCILHPIGLSVQSMEKPRAKLIGHNKEAYTILNIALAI